MFVDVGGEEVFDVAEQNDLYLDIAQANLGDEQCDIWSWQKRLWSLLPFNSILNGN